MNIIFLGGFFPKQYYENILANSKHQVQNAANNFQWAFITGIEENLNRPIKLLTAPYIGWYPKYYSELIFSKRTFSNGDVLKNEIMVGFLNLPIIKNVFKFFNLYHSLRKLIDTNRTNIIFVYSFERAYLQAALLAKSNNSYVKVCVIITDLYVNKKGNNLRHNIDFNALLNPIPFTLLSKADYYVVLTDKMAELLNLNRNSWVRIEGLLDEKAYTDNRKFIKENNEKVVLYTGTLDFRYGIEELLEAFKLINSQDYRLWICGSGVGSKIVQKHALNDKRIIYFGNVNKNKINELQNKATILINPRNTFGDYNKYSFPSKTIEYFASGTPTLMYKLEGIPEEYFNYCYTVDDNKVETLSKAIYNTCQINPRSLTQMGMNAREFILKYKTAKVQVSKVLKMISKSPFV